MITLNNKTDTPNQIEAFMHCAKCLGEWKEGKAPGKSPADYARLEVGWTSTGFQVWCRRHDLNVVQVSLPSQS